VKEEWKNYVDLLHESQEKLEKFLENVSKFETLRFEFHDWIASMETCPDSEVFLYYCEDL